MGLYDARLAHESEYFHVTRRTTTLDSDWSLESVRGAHQWTFFSFACLSESHGYVQSGDLNSSRSYVKGLKFSHTVNMSSDFSPNNAFLLLKKQKTNSNVFSNNFCITAEQIFPPKKFSSLTSPRNRTCSVLTREI